MLRMRSKMLLWTLAVTFFLAAGGAFAADAPRMSTGDLHARLGETGLAVIDVRSAGDWNSSTKMIKSAVRRDPKSVAAWAEEYERGQTIVTYCA